MSDAATRRFRAPPAWVVYFFLVLSIGSLIAAIFVPIRPVQSQSTTNQNEADNPQTFTMAPEFTLKERNGDTVKTEDLLGRVWVASFIFTRCTMGCPEVTGSMKRLQEEIDLANRDDLRLVTFTVDPERDQLSDLQKYADQQYGAHPTKWLFLTHGNGEYMRTLLRQGFKIGASKKENPQPGDEYDHSTRLIVVDKLGRMRRYFDGKVDQNSQDRARFETSFAEMKDLIEVLVKE